MINVSEHTIAVDTLQNFLGGSWISMIILMHVIFFCCILVVNYRRFSHLFALIPVPFVVQNDSSRIGGFNLNSLNRSCSFLALKEYFGLAFNP